MNDIVKVESLQELLHLIEFNENVVVVFSAVDWCIPCRKLASHLPAASLALKDHLFLDVDIDHVEGVKEAFNIMSVPRVRFYEDDDDEGRDIKARTALQLISEIQQ